MAVLLNAMALPSCATTKSRTTLLRPSAPMTASVSCDVPSAKRTRRRPGAVGELEMEVQRLLKCVLLGSTSPTSASRKAARNDDKGVPRRYRVCGKHPDTGLRRSPEQCNNLKQAVRTSEAQSSTTK